MATIPSKQLHRVGTTEQLYQNLSNREIGYSTTDSCGYIMLEGELKPLAENSDIPAPTSDSVLVGTVSGDYYWDSRGITQAPYDNDAQLWVSICGKGIYANCALNDTEGNFISSSTYKAPQVNPVNGSIYIEQLSSSNFMRVSIRKGNAERFKPSSYIPLGGLLPLPTGSMTPGDVLAVTAVSNGSPSIEWVSTHDTPTKDSKTPISSNAVYGLKYLIDPSVHTGNKTLTVSNAGSKYSVGYYYIIDNALYRCVNIVSNKAELTEEPGIVSALNNIVSMISGLNS